MVIAIVFPNIYSVGMASLGFQTAWKTFNKNENVKAVRWFTDIQEKTSSLPEYIGFSFSWELDYKNIFKILEKTNVSLGAKNRTKNDPLIFAGGQVPNANPEPFLDNFDFFLTGDLEATGESFINKLPELTSLSKEEKLLELSKIPGIYVPGISVKSIKREFSKENLSFSSILTEDCVWPNTFLVETVRGCPELCRFCLASYGSLPFRAPDVKKSLMPVIDFGLKYTKNIGLLGASVTQHPEFEKLIEYLLFKNKENKINVQIASVRADTITNKIASGLFELGSKSITMAVESGSEKLKDLINKNVSNETIFNSVQTIYNAGFNSIKLYGMVGLPFETMNDLDKTVDLLKQIKLVNKTKKLVWGCSVFVPKAQTPFQWFGMDNNAENKLKYLSKSLHKLGIEFRAESFRWAKVQTLISRGNKNINKLLERAYRYGSTLGSFNKACRELSSEINTEDIIFKTWGESTKLPWENVQGYLSTKNIEEHRRKVFLKANA